ncbi:MAG TPA: YeeE/YedE thiosulfate transporter family protein [Sphingomicrobium sp.]|nr:YeeE/YedE thiosulfate transporter family protein [Sphingomicrobium sp.]
MLEPLSPLYALAGGLLIGTATALFLLLSGRIAGVSGLAAAAARIADRGPEWSQAASFVIALPIGALIVSAFLRAPQVSMTSSLPLLIAGGMLVGFGTRLGNGCTSGHGVCGMARLSPRSIAATAMFMAFGFATVYVIRHVVGAAA